MIKFFIRFYEFIADYFLFNSGIKTKWGDKERRG